MKELHGCRKIIKKQTDRLTDSTLSSTSKCNDYKYVIMIFYGFLSHSLPMVQLMCQQEEARIKLVILIVISSRVVKRIGSKSVGEHHSLSVLVELIIACLDLMCGSHTYSDII